MGARGAGFLRGGATEGGATGFRCWRSIGGASSSDSSSLGMRGSTSCVTFISVISAWLLIDIHPQQKHELNAAEARK